MKEFTQSHDTFPRVFFMNQRNIPALSEMFVNAAGLRPKLVSTKSQSAELDKSTIQRWSRGAEAHPSPTGPTIPTRRRHSGRAGPRHGRQGPVISAARPPPPPWPRLPPRPRAGLSASHCFSRPRATNHNCGNSQEWERCRVCWERESMGVTAMGRTKVPRSRSLTKVHATT